VEKYGGVNAEEDMEVLYLKYLDDYMGQIRA